MSSSTSSTSSTKRKRVSKCSNCFVENPTHNYQNCKEPCNLCKKSDHKTRSCPFYKLKNRNKRQKPNPKDDNDQDNDQDATTSNASQSNNDPVSVNRELRETENVLSENGVFALAAMTSAVTLPTHFKSIEVQKYQIKFKTVNGFEGTIKLHTDENEVRNVREGFKNVNINYVNREHSTSDDGVEYSMKLNEKSVPRGGLEKIRRVGKFLCQAKYYKRVMPAKIPLRKTDISPPDWRVEKYVSWERKKDIPSTNDMELDENQSSSLTGSIYDDPPNVNVVITGWKRGKTKTSTYYFNPPQVPDWDQDNQELLSDYIIYLSEGLKFIQYNNEINRRSELRYCSYLDKAVEIYRQKTQPATPGNDILKIFLSESIDNSNKDRTYLCKKKMVGKRLNKIIDQCQLNWQIIDCVEELSTNFLTNTVQEENLNTLIDEINKEYTPKFSSFSAKTNEINEIDELIQGAKARLAEIKQLNLNEISTQVNSLKGTNELERELERFQTKFNEFEFDICEDENKRTSLDLNVDQEEEFNCILEERKEILSRLEVIIENANKL